MQLVMTVLLSGFGTSISQITTEILLKYLFNLHNIYFSQLANDVIAYTTFMQMIISFIYVLFPTL